MNTALNYQPEVLVDTADLSREEWLDYRRLGIGGSDAAAQGLCVRVRVETVCPHGQMFR